MDRIITVRDLSNRPRQAACSDRKPSAQQWNDDKACRAYFDDLLMGRRAKRRVFSANVRGELWLLREYFQRTRLTTDGQLEIV